MWKGRRWTPALFKKKDSLIEPQETTRRGETEKDGNLFVSGGQRAQAKNRVYPGAGLLIGVEKNART